jgi:STAS-like domain of unknown function (DUF4325)
MSYGITRQDNFNLMQLEINMLAEFGDFLADGHVGNRVMSLRVESVWDKCETIVFDFTGVHNITDSFVHATFGNMVEDHGDDFMKKTRFKGCNDLIKSFLSIAIGEGLKKHRQRNLR